ncbi:MAG: WD40 repeat domain-containing protein [Gemmataceae bacterium]
MRLLPRTPRGTRLLAGLAWAAGTAWLWWVLPPVPRVVIPNAGTFIGFLPDGASVLIASADSTVTRYDAATGRELSRFSLGQPATSHFWSATMSDDGRYLAWSVTGSSPFSVLVWDLAAGRPLADLPGNLPAFSPDGRRLVTTADGPLGNLRVWDLTQTPPTHRELVADEARKVESVGSFSFSRDGRLFAAVTGLTPTEAAIVCWRTDTWEVVGRHAVDVKDALVQGSLEARFLADGRLAAMYLGAPTLLLIDATTGDTSRLPLPMSMNVVSPAGRGRYVAAGTMTASVWDVLIERANRYGVSLPQRTPNAINLVDLSTGRVDASIPGAWAQHNGWSPDGTVLATTVENNGTIGLWDIPPRKPLAWIVGGSALLGLALAGLAQRRVRKLRRAHTQGRAG